jgi:DUF1680 family protein
MNFHSPSCFWSALRTWTPSDLVRLHLPMPVTLLEAHPYLFEDAGRGAIVRGPLLYTIEQADNPGIDLREVTVADDAEIVEQHQPALLGDVVTLRLRATLRSPDAGWHDRLYRAVRQAPAAQAGSQPVEVTAIPYFAWANREPGAMQTWLARQTVE